MKATLKHKGGGTSMPTSSVRLVSDEPICGYSGDGTLQSFIELAVRDKRQDNV